MSMVYVAMVVVEEEVVVEVEEWQELSHQR